jgi:hypothetical protein
MHKWLKGTTAQWLASSVSISLGIFCVGVFEKPFLFDVLMVQNRSEKMWRRKAKVADEEACEAAGSQSVVEWMGKDLDSESEGDWKMMLIARWM